MIAFGPLDPVRAVALIALVAGLSACDASWGGKEPAAPANAAVLDRPVLVAPVHFEDITEARTFAATVRARTESDLGFRVGGKVAQRLVQNGDTVRKGRPLLTLDTNDLKLQVEQAEAEVRTAKTNVMQAEADEVRATDLKSRGWASAATFEKSRAAAEEARTRLTRGQRALDLARNALDYASLEADADGVITATPVEPGQVVSAGQPAVRLARLAEVEAQVALPETFIERARSSVASLSLWSLPERAYRVRLRELSGAADLATRTYAARYTILEPDDAVRLGMSATLTLRAANGLRAARLPLTALFNHGKGPMVWVTDRDGHLGARAVEIARYDERNVLVSGGLAEGEKVVMLGVEKLDAGMTVRTVESLSF
jgi:RND family efflux transporter MFP subunit